MQKESEELFNRISGILDPAALLEFLLGFSGSGGSAGPPVASGVPRIYDTDILRKFLPAELYRSLMADGVFSRHALAFALRRRFCFLNVLFHLSVLPIPMRQAYRKIFEGYFREDFSEWMELPATFNGAAGTPVFGFSAAGIHYVFRSSGGCRAFDYYDLSHCSAAGEPLFCAAHAAEAWWETVALERGSTQAKMYSFYAERGNFFKLDERQLHELTGRFWHAFQKWSSGQNVSLEPACRVFDLSGREELQELGLVGLRRRYVALVQRAHPDHGGSEEGFITLQAAYDLLRTYLAGC